MIPYRLGAIVVKRYGTGDEKGELAEILSCCDAPSFQLRAADGSEYHWRQDLTRDATTDEAIHYWRDRVEKLERLQAKLIEANGKLLDRNSALVERLSEAETKE